MNAAIKVTTDMTLKEIEKEVIYAVLEEKAYNKTHTAQALGIGLRTLQRKLLQYRQQDAKIEGIGEPQCDVEVGNLSEV